MIKLSWIVTHSQRLYWQRKFEFRCSIEMWNTLLCVEGMPASLLRAIGTGKPIMFGPVVWRLETPTERATRLRFGAMPSVPLIARNRSNEDR